MPRTNEIGYQAVPLAGGTMTGLLVLSGDPVTALGAATKQYADAIAGGFTVKQACVCTTTGNLNATPVGAGIGATLTNAGAQAAFSSDGVTPAINSRVLVKDQTLTQHNGIYRLTTVGSGVTNWVLTRATDYDQPAEIQPGNLIPVTMGTLYAQTSWIETATVTTVDTDPILFSQFTASPNTFATVSLSNLAGVAINTDLLPNANETLNLGSIADRWLNGYIKSIRTNQSGGDTTDISAYDTLGAVYDQILLVTAGNPPSATLSGIVTSTTQAANDNSTKIATTAYTDTAVATSANRALSNLSSVAINTALLPTADGTIDLGSAAKRFRNGLIETLQTGTTLAQTLLIEAYNTNTASYTAFATLTAGNPPTMALSGSVTSTTQAANDNSTKLATTAYVDNATGGGSGANAALSNLAAVAINTALLPGADGTIDLGNATHRFRNALIQTAQTGTTAANTLLLQAYDTNGAAYTTFATLTAGNPPTMSLASSVTGTTQAASDNSTKLATTAYADNQVSTISANKALSNLASVAINTALLPTADNTIDLGSASKRFRNALIETVQTGTTGAQTVLLQAYDTNGAAYTTFATLTAGNPPTFALASAVTAITQSPGDNTTKIATTAFVTAAVGVAGGANTALSNLAAVAINTDLLGSADNSRSLGNATVRWKDIFPTTIKTGTTAGNNYVLQAYDTNAASYTTFATLTANNPATMALASGVTGVTQSAADNSTKLATTAYADRMLPLAGGTMTGNLILNGVPTTALQAATKAYADLMVPLAGGTMSGLLILSGDPVTALGAVTKQYADAISSGLDIKSPAYAATTANLNATYLNGAAGIGATLVNAGALAAFSVDGVSPPINSRILVKNQTSSFQNGIYVLSTVGSGAVAWILTRSTDYDQAPSEIFPGNFIIVDNGTVNATTGWIQTATVTTVGTDAITFSQFGATLPLPVSLANGGTNASLTANTGGIVYSGASALAILAGTATANQVLMSGATAAPAWSTATYPATTTVNRILYSSATNVVGQITTANSGLLVTDGSGVPSIGTAIPNGVTATTQSASDNSTKVATTAYVDGLFPLALSKGGTNANLTANNGGIFYSTATAGAILAGTATARQMLQSGATAAPTWSTTTWPATTTVNRILYSSATSVIGEITTANSGLLVTDGSGVPSIGTAIPNGVTATTQSASDNSTKVATTAYVDAAAGGGGSLTLIASATASSSATVDFANNLSSTYDNYLVIIENLVCATDATTHQMRVGTGGTPTYQTTGYKGLYASSRVTTADTGTGPATSTNDTTVIDVTGNIAGSLMSNNSTNGAAGRILVTNANNSSNNKSIICDTVSICNGLSSGTGVLRNQSGGQWQSATVLTSLRFLQSSGNITSGIYKLYGYKN